MRRDLIAEADVHSIVLRQLGADVLVINSLLCYISFDVKGTEISYVYNINRENQYFLQRINPYDESIGAFDNEEDIVKIIKTDIDQFKNAVNSHHFEEFIEFNRGLTEAIKNFEELYLHYNVPNEAIKEIKMELYKIEELIKTTKKTSERVYKK